MVTAFIENVLWCLFLPGLLLLVIWPRGKDKVTKYPYEREDDDEDEDDW